MCTFIVEESQIVLIVQKGCFACVCCTVDKYGHFSFQDTFIHVFFVLCFLADILLFSFWPFSYYALLSNLLFTRNTLII